MMRLRVLGWMVLFGVLWVSGCASKPVRTNWDEQQLQQQYPAKSPSEAQVLFEQALALASQGSKVGHYLAGMHYLEGGHLNHDLAKAKHHLEQAVDLGHRQAQVDLALLLFDEARGLEGASNSLILYDWLKDSYHERALDDADRGWRLLYSAAYAGEFRAIKALCFSAGPTTTVHQRVIDATAWCLIAQQYSEADGLGVEQQIQQLAEIDIVQFQSRVQERSLDFQQMMSLKD